VARYFLDSDTLIDYSKGHEPVTSRVRTLLEHEHEIGICAIQIGEFFTGLPPEDREAWSIFLSSIHLWEISIDAAIRAGSDRYHFARQGQQLSLTDCLTAAAAREHDAILLTNNLRHFPMTDLRAHSLRESPNGQDIV
jgi:predicted nucleic acid-binding protein